MGNDGTMSPVEDGMGRAINFKKLFMAFFMCLCLGVSGASAHVDDVHITELTRQAEAGYDWAQSLLGSYYANGEHVPQNDKKAAHYFKLASEQGYFEAQYNLGLLYDFGRGVPQNHKKAAHYYELAARQGYVDAQFNIGVMYANGDGVPQDDKKAIYYFELSGKQGHIGARINLGVMHGLGHGVPQDYVKAYAHALIAAASDATQSDLKEFLEPKLTPSQREKAQALAAKMWEELPK